MSVNRIDNRTTVVDSVLPGGNYPSVVLIDRDHESVRVALSPINNSLGTATVMRSDLLAALGITLDREKVAQAMWEVDRTGSHEAMSYEDMGDYLRDPYLAMADAVLVAAGLSDRSS
jgi:hypothetical protein